MYGFPLLLHLLLQEIKNNENNIIENMSPGSPVLLGLEDPAAAESTEPGNAAK